VPLLGLRSGIPRDQLFVAAKLSPTSAADFAYDVVKERCRASLQKLGVAYVDVYYLHGPVDDEPATMAARLDAWRAVEDLVSEGLVRMAGVSNFDVPQLAHLVESARTAPAVAQVKADAYHYGAQLNPRGEDAAEFAESRRAAVVGYAPLSGWPFALVPARDAHVVAVARRIGRTPAQVLLRWRLQRGHGVLVRSSDAAHLAENLRVADFELTAFDMQSLSGLAWLTGTASNRPNSRNTLAVDPLGSGM